MYGLAIFQAQGEFGLELADDRFLELPGVRVRRCCTRDLSISRAESSCSVLPGWISASSCILELRYIQSDGVGRFSVHWRDSRPSDLERLKQALEVRFVNHKPGFSGSVWGMEFRAFIKSLK